MEDRPRKDGKPAEILPGGGGRSSEINVNQSHFSNSIYSVFFDVGLFDKESRA